MRVAVFTVGSRGDVQQYVALARGLQHAGHDVRFVTHPEFEGFVRGYGLDFVALPGNPFLGLNAGLVAPGDDAREPADERIARAMREWVECGLEAVRGADALVYSQLAFVGYHIAEALRIPAVWANHTPAHRTRCFPTAYQRGDRSWGALHNLVTHELDQRLFWLGMRRRIDALRRDVLGLPPIGWSGIHARMRRERHPTIYGFSPRVVPKPADWGDWIEVAGFWHLERPDDFEPPADLARFLASGPPPIYLGLGSVANTNPVRVTRAAVAAIARAGLRLVVMPGQVDLADMELPAETFVVRSVPHDWLFPQVSAVIHHGGVGTMATAMRAGVPSLGVPFFGDQYFWSHRLHRVGVGPAPVPREAVSIETIGAALRVLDDPAVRERAAALGRALRTEDGTSRSVEAVHRFVAAAGNGGSR